jgi:putative transposase
VVGRSTPASSAGSAASGGDIAAVGRAPKYIITDKGGQFSCPGFKKWCQRCGIRPRFGAVGRYGSIAVVERFIKTFKDEGLRRIRVPLRKQNLRCELEAFLLWYNEARPHTTLGGKTPHEAYNRVRPRNTQPRHEPRSRWPQTAPCAAPRAPARKRQGAALELRVTFAGGRKHLPVVELRAAA